MKQNLKWNLKQISHWVKGEIISSEVQEFNSIGTDTRTDLNEKIFFALKGELFDSHDFLDQAVEKGAKLLIVHSEESKWQHLKSKVSIIKVSDTLTALQNMAKEYRKSLHVKVLAITGSNGKTTTKEFTAQILSGIKKTHYSKGSFNNHWGVPFTLLAMPLDTEIAVIEMGMNHAGELTELVQIADPDICVCTTVGSAHIEFFGSVANIAKAKSEIYMAARPNCVRIFNQDQEHTFDMMYPVAKNFPESRMLSFSSKNNEADVFFKLEESSVRELKISGLIGGEKGEAIVGVFGEHNLVNLMAAACLAYAAKVKPEQIWSSLKNCQTTWGRNQFIQTKSGAEILFDAYNANPDSMMALIQNIKSLNISGRKIAVLGQMKELGEESINAHSALGKVAAEADFAEIYFVGSEHKAFFEGLTRAGYKGEVHHAIDYSDELANILASKIKNGDVICVKGSRGMKMERFVESCAPLNWEKKV